MSSVSGSDFQKVPNLVADPAFFLKNMSLMVLKWHFKTGAFQSIIELKWSNL
jgi:hypothetical protein